MNTPRQIVIEGRTVCGDTWKVQADMDGDELGLIYLVVHNASGQATAMGNVIEIEKLVDALRHTATSIAWIKEHGLMPTHKEQAHGNP